MDREMLVLVHAGAGVAALVAGLPVFRPPRAPEHRRWWRLSYGALLVVMVVALVALVATDWRGLPVGSRIAFSGLTILGFAILARIFMAHRLADGRETDWRHRYVSHVYFTYISLWVGFAILPAVRSNNPALWIPVAVAGILLAGSLLLRRYESGIGLETQVPPP